MGEIVKGALIIAACIAMLLLIPHIVKAPSDADLAIGRALRLGGR